MWQTDFERRKEYLIRSLFQDIPLLSPVPEEEESYDSPRRVPSPCWLPPERPYSPLPPLIIEVEKRVNIHDEPEEFYVQLEKKVLRIYRRLFSEGRNVSSGMSSTSLESVEDNDEEEIVDIDVDDGDDNDLEAGIGDADDDNDLEAGISDIDDDNDLEAGIGDVDDDNDLEAGIGDDGNDLEEEISGIDDAMNAPERGRSLKRSTSPESDSESEVKSKRSKSNKNDCSSTDDNLRSSSEKELDEESTISSIAEENILDEDNEGCNVERDDTYDSSASLGHIQVTFQADVHRSFEDEPEEDNPLLPEYADDEIDEDSLVSENNVITTQEININRMVSENNVNTVMPDIEVEVMRTPSIHPEPESINDGVIEFLGNNAENQFLPASVREVEVMRTPRLHSSMGSIHENLADSNGGNNMADIRAQTSKHRQVEAYPDSPSENTDENAMEHEIDFDFLNQTVSLVDDDNTAGADIGNQPADDNSTEYKDEGVQTSLDNVSRNEEILKEVFSGGPKVFRLCHCTHHLCDF